MASRQKVKSSQVNVMDLDLYDILDVLHDADADAIKKAYRKRALKCHPDKNPDNPNAAAEWEKLAKTLEILSDPEARAAYDRILKARKAAELRNKALDSKRRKIKEDLESREAAFQKDQENTARFSFDLEKEIKRLREEGSQTLRREQELLKEELLRAEPEEQEETPKLRLKWKSQKGDPLNGGYSQTILKHIFDKYGEVRNLILSSKRNGSAIIEFASARAAEIAVSNEFGLPGNPLQLSWLSGKPAKARNVPMATVPPMGHSAADEFENAVLQKLTQAQQKRDQVVDQTQEAEDQKEEQDQAPNEDDILQKLMQAKETNGRDKDNIKEEEQERDPSEDDILRKMMRAQEKTKLDGDQNEDECLDQDQTPSEEDVLQRMMRAQQTFGQEKGDNTFNASSSTVWNVSDPADRSKQYGKWDDVLDDFKRT